MKFAETETTELKRILNDSFEKALVAFLNSMDGTIYIGVDDKGEVLGVENLDKTQKEIADIITTRILPNPQESVDLGSVYVDGKNVIKVNVRKGNALYYIKQYGRSAQGCYVRIGTSCRSMTEEEIERRYKLAVSVEAASITEMRSHRQDLTFNLLKQALTAKGFHINDDTFPRNLDFITVSGEYNELANLLADENDVSVKVAVFKGKDKTQYLKRNEYGYTSLIISLQKVIDYCDAINDTYIEIGKMERKETKKFDQQAFREAWINACVHNDWKQGVPPVIYVFDDRLEIHSIGGIPKGSTKEKFLKGESVPVNKALMRIFIMLDIVEQTGHGVPIVVDKYGESAFEFDDNFIIVTIPFAEVTKNMEVPNKVTGKVACKVTGKVTSAEQNILNAIADNPNITILGLSEAIGLSISGIRKNLSKLKEKGILRRVGSDKSGYWEIITE